LVAALAKKHADVTAYCVGYEDSEDVKWAIDVAAALELRLVIRPVSDREVHELIPIATRVVESYDKVMVENAVASMVATVAAAEDGCEAVLCGFGADELFLGYSFFLTRSSFPRPDLADFYIENMYRFDLQRIERVATHFGIDVRFPYLDHRVVEYARRLPVQAKFCRGRQPCQEKLLLREAAEMVLPRRFAWRQKCMFIDGSGIGSRVRSSALACGATKLSDRLARAWKVTTPTEAAYLNAWAPQWEGYAAFQLDKFRPDRADGLFHIGYD